VSSLSVATTGLIGVTSSSSLRIASLGHLDNGSGFDGNFLLNALIGDKKYRAPYEGNLDNTEVIGDVVESSLIEGTVFSPEELLVSVLSTELIKGGKDTQVVLGTVSDEPIIEGDVDDPIIYGTYKMPLIEGDKK